MVLTLRNRLKVLVYIGAGVILLMSLFDHRPAGVTRGRLAVLELVLFAVITAFDRWLWRLGPAPLWLRTGPVLRGTWRGEVLPSDGSGRRIPAYLSVQQTYSGLSVRLLTEESASDSTSAVLRNEADGLAVVEYFYENVPRDSVRETSPLHFGGVRFECVGPHPARIEGSYFTSRRTSGELQFNAHVEVVLHSFADAEQASLWL